MEVSLERIMELSRLPRRTPPQLLLLGALGIDPLSDPPPRTDAGTFCGSDPSFLADHPK